MVVEYGFFMSLIYEFCFFVFVGIMLVIHVLNVCSSYLNIQIVCKTPMNVYTPNLQNINTSLLSNNVCAEYKNKLKQN